MAKRAFTLVELLVVIAIIALLISILAPSLKIAKDIAKLVICSTNINGTGKAVLMYCETNKGWIPPVYPNNYKASLSPAWRDMYTASAPWHGLRTIEWESQYVRKSWGGYQGLGLLYQGGTVTNANLFYCPSRTSSDEWNRDYTRAYWPTVWDSEARSDGSGGWSRHRTSYHLAPVQTDKQHKDGDMQYYSTNQIDSAAVMVMDLLKQLPSEGDWNNAPSTIHLKPTPTWNMSFLDSHVERKSNAAANKLVADGFADVGAWEGFVVVFKKIMQ
jgi:prepilin-type N-terminal cleavage/methylation domain-containing protein